MERARKMHLLMVLLVIPISFPGKSDLRKRDKAFSFTVADINGEIYMGHSHEQLKWNRELLTRALVIWDTLPGEFAP